MEFGEVKKNWGMRIFLVFLVLVLAIVVFLYVYIFVDFGRDKSSVNNTVNVTVIPVNYTNFATEVSKNYVIEALPEDALILLKFYNFSSGERVWEASYIIKKSSVKEGSVDNPDITLLLSSKYLDGLTNTNFCDIIKTARANGDLGFETDKSSAGLAWEYKSVLKYKSCFGM
jgi:hypothetical protein